MTSYIVPFDIAHSTPNPSKFTWVLWMDMKLAEILLECWAWSKTQNATISARYLLLVGRYMWSTNYFIRKCRCFGLLDFVRNGCNRKCNRNFGIVDIYSFKVIFLWLIISLFLNKLNDYEWILFNIICSEASWVYCTWLKCVKETKFIRPLCPLSKKNELKLYCSSPFQGKTNEIFCSVPFKKMVNINTSFGSSKKDGQIVFFMIVLVLST